MYRKTYLKINVDNYIKNAKEYLSHSGKKILAVVKADAYGLCDYQMSKYLEEIGVDFFAVSSIEEGLRLRKHGINSDILMLSYAHDLDICKNNNISIIIPNKQFIEEYKEKLKGIKVHIKLNTGLNRLGFLPSELNDVIKELTNYGALVEGIMTHYAKAADKEYTEKQYKLFEDAVKNSNHKFKYVHSCASDASIYVNDTVSNYIRIGTGMIGLSAVETPFKLETVVTVTAEVIDCKQIKKGEGVSYDFLHISDGVSYYLTCAIGYADGLDVQYSGKEVYVNGQFGTIVGEVCMDLIMVKVAKPCNIGDEVEILGEHYSADRRAKEVHSNYHKVITDLSDRITKQYYVNGKLVKEINNRFDD